MMSYARQLVLSLILLLLVACSSGTAQQSPLAPTQTAPSDTSRAAETTAPVPPRTASPTVPPIAATATIASTPADMAQDAPADATETPSPDAATATVVVNGLSADGAYFLGREDAPLTIIDYSDFL